MTGKAFLTGLPFTFCTLTMVGFSATASAEYRYYLQPTQPIYQDIYPQQASRQPQIYSNNQTFDSPEIMPYVPFDDEQRFVTPQQQFNHYQHHYQPQETVVPQQLNHYHPQEIVIPEQPDYYQPQELVVPQQPNYYQAPAQTNQSSHYQPRPRTWRQPVLQQHTPNSTSAVRQKVLRVANRQMGIRYRWGGNTPRQGFDCSGFTKYVMQGSNIKIPRTAAQQSRASRTISRSQLRPGDLIFFKTSGRRVSHVGIYIGSNRFIHAAYGGGKIMTDDLRKHYWQKRLHKYGTFLS